MAVNVLRPTTLFLALAGASAICSAQVNLETAADRFNVLDSNRDGVVSKLEYNSDALFSSLDSDRNHRITAQELQATVGEQWEGVPSAADWIRIADSNSDGELNDEELRRRIETRFRELDANKDGNVDLPELMSGFGRY